MSMACMASTDSTGAYVWFPWLTSAPQAGVRKPLKAYPGAGFSMQPSARLAIWMPNNQKGTGVGGNILRGLKNCVRATVEFLTHSHLPFPTLCQ